jgi:hypothetical protein
MHCQTLLPGKSGIVIKEDPESQYHLLQGSSGLFSLQTGDGRPIRHYLDVFMEARDSPLPLSEPALAGILPHQRKQKNQHN